MEFIHILPKTQLFRENDRTTPILKLLITGLIAFINRLNNNIKREKTIEILFFDMHITFNNNITYIGLSFRP